MPLDPNITKGLVNSADDVVFAAARGATQNSGRPPKKAVKKTERARADADDVPTPGIKPDTTEEFIDASNTWLNRGAMGAMLLPPVLSGIGGMASKAKFAPIAWVGKKLQAPAEYLARPFGDTGLGKVTTQVGQGIANAIAKPVSGITGFMAPKMAKRNAALAERHLGDARKMFERVDLTAVPEGIRAHVEELQGMVKNTASAPQLDAAKIRQAAEAVKDSEGMFGGIRPKPYRKLATSLENAVEHHHSGLSWSGVESAVKKAPAELGKMDTAHVLTNGAWAAMSGLSIASDAHTFTKGIATLKQMYTDITGQQASTVGVLFGKVPNTVAQARSHLLKNYFIKSGSDTIGLGVMLKMLFNRHFGSGLKGMAAFALPQAIAFGADMVMGQSVLPSYQMLHDSYQKGKMPEQYYAAFVGNMHKELVKRGGEESVYAKALAKQYVETQATPADMLKELENGEMTKRIDAIIAEFEAEKAQKAHPANQRSKERPVVGKHTENLSREASASLQKPGISPTVS